MVEGQKVLIDACIAENVPRYIASDFSFDFRGLSMGEFPYKDCQLKIRDYLQKQEDVGTIQAVHVLNGGFHEAVLSAFMGVLNIESKKVCYWGTGDETWEITSMENTAEFAAEVASDPDAVGVIRGRSILMLALQVSNEFQSEVIQPPLRRSAASSATFMVSTSDMKG